MSEQICFECGAEMPADANFCRESGSEVDELQRRSDGDSGEEGSDSMETLLSLESVR